MGGTFTVFITNFLEKTTNQFILEVKNKQGKTN